MCIDNATAGSWDPLIGNSDISIVSFMYFCKKFKIQNYVYI